MAKNQSAAVLAVDEDVTALPMERTMKTQLKIKIKSLAAEARIIRAEEFKWAKKITYIVTDARTGEAKTRIKYVRKDHPVAESIRDHRRGPVRREARAALLAYGFLRGRDYRMMEAKTWTKPDWQRVREIIGRFSNLDRRIVDQRFESWMPQGKGA